MFIFSVWSFFLMNKTDFSFTEHGNQYNTVKIEKFLYSERPKNRVIIGTSLSQRIETDSLQNTFNLALSGQSIYDGLNILQYSEIIPDEVLIESNLILKDDNDLFLESMKSPVANILKKNLLAFRTDKHPLAYIGNEYVIPNVKIIIPKKETKIGTLKDGFFQELLNEMIKLYSKPIHPNQLEHRINTLQEYVTYLQKNNVQVVFFEMPIHTSLIHLNRPAISRKIIKEKFPHIRYIDIPENTTDYKTTDGIHLSKKEALEYTQYLEIKLDTKEKAPNYF